MSVFIPQPLTFVVPFVMVSPVFEEETDLASVTEAGGQVERCVPLTVSGECLDGVEDEELGGHHAARHDALMYRAPGLLSLRPAPPLRVGPQGESLQHDGEVVGPGSSVEQHVGAQLTERVVRRGPDALILLPLPVSALLVTVQLHTGHVVFPQAPSE